MALDLQITAADVKNMLRDQNFAAYDGFDADILRSVKRQTKRVTVLIRQQGYDPTEVEPDTEDEQGNVTAEGKHQELWWMCQEIVLLRCAAELEESISHARTALSGSRYGRAAQIAQEIIDMSESVSSDFDPKTHRGSWSYNDNEGEVLMGAEDGNGCSSTRWGNLRGL